MKKFLLLILPFLANQVGAQCPVTIQGNSFFSICSGGCATFTATGAQSYTWVPTGGNGSTATVCPTTTTTFTVYGASNGGTCLDSATVTVMVDPTPTVTASGCQNPVCAGGTCTLTASGAISYTWGPGSGLSCTSCAQVVVSPSSTTTYTLIGTDANGCYDATTFVVAVNPPPSVTFTLVNSSPQVWDAYPTFTGGSAPFTYMWNWGDGNSSSTQFPSHTYSTPGWYNVCCAITDANGCTDTFCSLDSLYKMSSTNSMITFNVINGSMGAPEKKNDQPTVFPNPANSNFAIETHSPETYTIYLFDLSGKKILSENIKGKGNIETTDLPEGVYMLKLKGAGKEIIRKLVVVH